MGWIIFILSVVVITLSFLCYNLYKKVVFFEDKIIEIQERIQDTISIMREIDLRGAFESDDEVGSVFSQMKRLVDNLTVFIRDIKLLCLYLCPHPH